MSEQAKQTTPCYVCNKRMTLTPFIAGKLGQKKYAGTPVTCKPCADANPTKMELVRWAYGTMLIIDTPEEEGTE